MTAGGTDEQRALLRQLRDLDDDLAAGKLTEEDHRRHRDPLEREVATLLRDPPQRAQDRGAGARPARRSPGDATAAPARRRRRLAVVVALAAAAAAVGVLLAGAIAPRQPGQTVSGALPAASGAPGPGGAAPSGSVAPGGSAAPGDQAGAGDPGSPSAERTPTPEQAAAIAAAAIAVKAHPQDVSKHLALAHAYADGGTAQLAAVEYLAILKLEPANAEANTALALLAFEVGQTAQAKQMADRALTTDPKYPEGLYVRALILLMGLHQPQAAIKDLHAYLAVAPYGAHRTAADTLLALAGSQAGG